jgi:hypothetical protein
MAHIAIQEALDGKVVEWMEKVSEETIPSEVRAAASQSGQRASFN